MCPYFVYICVFFLTYLAYIFNISSSFFSTRAPYPWLPGGSWGLREPQEAHGEPQEAHGAPWEGKSEGCLSKNCRFYTNLAF